MTFDRDDELDRIRRSIALLAEAVDEALGAMQQHIYAGEWSGVDGRSRLALDRARGKLNAVRSSLGVGEPRQDDGPNMRPTRS